MLEITTSWQRQGRQEGRREGLQEGLGLALQARFGDASSALIERLSQADDKQLNRLKKKFLKASLADLEKLF